jgi:hypothetical protein
MRINKLTADVFLPHTNTLFVFLHLCLTDQDRTEAIIRPALGLLGDLAEAYGARLKGPLSQEWVGDSYRVARARTYQSGELKKVIRWSKEVRWAAVSGEYSASATHRWSEERQSRAKRNATCSLSCRYSVCLIYLAFLISRPSRPLAFGRLRLLSPPFRRVCVSFDVRPRFCWGGGLEDLASTKTSGKREPKGLLFGTHTSI